VSPIDPARAVSFATADAFDSWLRDRGASEREVLVAIYKKASGKQTVTYDALLETALCHGWIDNLGGRIDDERYAVRFVPRRSGSNWSANNREIARRLLREGRMTAAGKATLPSDL
jgi:uncharacterized protein YdeI (YjbR/CyaY-like superfamily)